ncbi:hypothetical protein [Gryllotalpicola koreensis]|uniref:Uncharacterized protein n=1 Tax=Gryllotalpicola koreensis TaxID=993086 RepID=A0ABP7ZS01_9MICO
MTAATIGMPDGMGAEHPSAKAQRGRRSARGDGPQLTREEQIRRYELERVLEAEREKAVKIHSRLI